MKLQQASDVITAVARLHDRAGDSAKAEGLRAFANLLASGGKGTVKAWSKTVLEAQSR